MGWESVNAISAAGGAVATTVSTLIAFMQFRYAKKTEIKNKSLEKLNEQLEVQSLNHQKLLTTIQELAEQFKEFKTKLPNDQVLNEQINSFEKEVEKFQRNLNSYKEAALWLSNKNQRLHLAKDLGDEAIKIFSLKLLKDKRYKFYKDIYKYLTWLYYTLNYGAPMPKELITKSLHKKQYYEAALNSILKMMPKDLSDGAVKLVEEHITDLILSLG
ncbi:hypothetical protein [Mastigocoleus sp. MO_188.B34]|uniref:hypothetical protein n=1 Tax=Mastigocoleus sp. MO_188.B34 TaxID=3036635 RepID=UPI00262D4D51|nr:hypothetical protein [Mastigocoleus sp. MO_188.B34]MDJ0696335.1 hypothetical protein [Mastigocoleus sp. MO_188.B34]